jgi:hypothetical protein
MTNGRNFDLLRALNAVDFGTRAFVIEEGIAEASHAILTVARSVADVEEVGKEPPATLQTPRTTSGRRT